eukprot:GHVS01004833.1.p1 GENE.GHVS01004833.1~~GHVS01004833.1.p1  ORF type:complete len:107 (-),score=20.19 GHVS01004833.1:284-604(-)
MSASLPAATSTTSNSVVVDVVNRWNILYPNYLNRNKTACEGRRVSKAVAVENPACQEMKVVCEHLKIPVKAEMEKCYSRDFMVVGRIRYRLRRENGELVDSSISSS